VLNPLRSEAEAFRFLIASIAYFGAIVIASVAGGTWVALGVFIALTAGGAPPAGGGAGGGGGARAAAQERLEKSLAQLAAAGVEARGEVGDGDPLQAIADALRTFGADEIIISTHPEGRSNWLERGIVEHARERFAVPITHVVVDLAAERPGGN